MYVCICLSQNPSPRPGLFAQYKSRPLLQPPFIVHCSVCNTRAAEVLASDSASSPAPSVTGPHFSLNHGTASHFRAVGMRRPADGAL